MYVCMSCYEIFDSTMAIIQQQTRNVLCVKAGCVGNVVEIDELFIPVIIELNKKGYTTEFCCSGHIWSKIPNAYIKFKTYSSGYINKFIDTLPKGYMAEKNMLSGGTTIRKSFNGKGLELQREITENACKTLEWALSLPNKS